MKIRKLALLGSAAYLSTYTYAHAGIETLIIGIHGFLLSSTAVSAAAAGALATVIGYGIAGAALVGVALLGRPQQPGAVKPSDAKSNFETGESSVIEGVGRVRVGGLKIFGNSDGSTRARLLGRLQGPIDGVENYFLGQREVTVESNGDVSSPPWARPGGSWANWQDKLGTGSETSWSGLSSLFPSIWTAAHRVRGIAQSQLLFYNPGLQEKKYLSLYQSGAPDSEWICRAAKVYDPRTGLVAWSDNSPLICAHVLRRDPAFTFDRFNWDKIAVTANAADVLVPTKTGTEKRSRLWGMWAWESERGSTMQQFLDSAGLEIRLDEDGKIYFEFIEDVITPEIDFFPEDIYDFTWASGPEAVERPNIARVKYYSPERNYELTDLVVEDVVSWARIDEEVERYGPKYYDLDLPFCPSASQAQRILRRKFSLSRADRGSATTNMVGLAAWGLLYAQITDPDLGDVENVRIEAPRIDDDNGSVEIPFVVWPTLTPWNPATDEAPAPDPIPELGYETEIIQPNPPSSAIQITYPGGGKELRIGFTLPVQEYDVVEANYRIYVGGLPQPYQGMAEIGSIGAYDTGDFIGQTINARVRVFNGDDGSYFSDPATLVVFASNAACAAPDLVGGGVDGSGLNVIVRANELRCASIRLQRRVGVLNPWVTVLQPNARPTQNITFTSSADPSPSTTTYWQIQTITSDGTVGAALGFNYTTSSS
jgi:hypothetical protein